MKFKGFWKSYWNLCMSSFKWLKEYWLAYTIVSVVVIILSWIGTIVYFCGMDGFKSLFKKRTNEDDEDF